MSTEADPLFWPVLIVSAFAQPVFIAKLVQRLRRSETLQSILQALRRMPPPPRAENQCDQPSEDMCEEIERLMVIRRVHAARMGLTAVWGAACIYIWSLLADVVTGQDRTATSQAPWRTLAALVIVTALTVGVLFPRICITRHSLRVWLAGGFLVLCATIMAAGKTPMGNAWSLLLGYPLGVLCSLSLSVICLEFRLLILGNIAVSVCNIIAGVSKSSPCGGDIIEVRAFAIVDIAILVWKCMLIYWAERVVRLSVRKQVEAAWGKCHGSAVSSLLALLCDAVVDLDENLLLKEHFEKLGGLLMHGGGRSLRGLAFSDFIALGEDKQRFQEVVRERENAPGVEAKDEAEVPPPRLLSVRMRDSLGNRPRVSLYHLPYRSVSGRIHHLVGLQEAAAAEMAGGGVAEGAIHGQRHFPQAVLNPTFAQNLGASTPGDPSSFSMGAPNSHHSGSSIASMGRAASFGELSSQGSEASASRRTPAAVDVDVWAEEGMPVMKASVLDTLGFAGTSGRFADLMSSRNVDRVLAVADSVRRGEREPFIGKWYDLKLKVVGQPSSNFKACLVFKHGPPPLGEDFQFTLRLMRKEDPHAYRSRQGPLFAAASRGPILPL